jgi:hypothetical protein
VRLLIPHLDRALRLQMRLNLADLHRGMLSGSLDYLAHGFVLVDRSGSVVAVWSYARDVAARPVRPASG